MKLTFNFNPIKKRLLEHINTIIYVFIILSITGFLYFFYSQVYITIINPKEIDKNAIIAKKQKVNLDLFNKVIGKIQTKITPLTIDQSQKKDPFAGI